MKSEELCIGDLVLINGIPKKVQAVDGVDNEIIADGEIYYLAKYRHHSENVVTGIPLTAKILEKNGFKNYGESWYLPDDDVNVMVGFYMYKTTIHVKKGDDIFQKEIHCSYRACAENRRVHVHILQRALRLCGIEHGIIL